MTPRPLWIVGAGGHAKVVIEAAQLGGVYEVVGCLDDRAETIGSTVLGVPVVAPITEASIVAHAVRDAVLAIGNNTVRYRLAQHIGNKVRWASVIHPGAIVSPTATIGAGAVVCAGAVVQVDACVGQHSIINTGATVDHDARVGAFVHLGPGVHLAGDVAVGTGAFLGVGANVIPGKRIGRWTTVGAGAVVTRDVEDEATVVGVPAKPINPTT